MQIIARTRDLKETVEFPQAGDAPATIEVSMPIVFNCTPDDAELWAGPGNTTRVGSVSEQFKLASFKGDRVEVRREGFHSKFIAREDLAVSNRVTLQPREYELTIRLELLWRHSSKREQDSPYHIEFNDVRFVAGENGELEIGSWTGSESISQTSYELDAGARRAFSYEELLDASRDGAVKMSVRLYDVTAVAGGGENLSVATKNFALSVPIPRGRSVRRVDIDEERGVRILSETGAALPRGDWPELICTKQLEDANPRNHIGVYFWVGIAAEISPVD